MKVILLVLFFIFNGCAQLHSGNYAKSVQKEETLLPNTNSNENCMPDRGNGSRISSSCKNSKSRNLTKLGLVVSAEIDDLLSSKHFAYIRFVFENTTDEWIRINSVSVNFGNKVVNNNVRFVSGQQLHYFLQAKKREIEIERENSQKFAAAMAGVAAAMAAAGQSSNDVNYNKGVYTGVATSLTISQFQNISNKMKTEKIFPEQHLMYKDFVIPPGLFSQKFLVLNTKNHNLIGFIEDIYVTYKMNNGKKDKLIVPLRNSFGISKWQNDVRRIPIYGSDERKKYEELEKQRSISSSSRPKGLYGR